MSVSVCGSFLVALFLSYLIWWIPVCNSISIANWKISYRSWCQKMAIYIHCDLLVVFSIYVAYITMLCKSILNMYLHATSNRIRETSNRLSVCVCVCTTFIITFMLCSFAFFDMHPNHTAWLFSQQRTPNHYIYIHIK